MIMVAEDGKKRVSTHSRAKAAAFQFAFSNSLKMFQHTAARKRLPTCQKMTLSKKSFNTQPRESGCLKFLPYFDISWSFNTQPRESGCRFLVYELYISYWFQHTAARKRLLVTEAHHQGIKVVSTHSRAKAAA